MGFPTGFSTVASAIEFADNYNKWIVKQFYPFIGKKVLEIGVGQGNYKRYLPSLDLIVSIDIDIETIKRAQSRDRESIYLVVDASDPKLAEKLGLYSFDTIICINVLEHIPANEKAIKNMMSILKPGGNLLLFVPALPALYTDMDKLAGHIRRYKKYDIKKLFYSNECTIEKLEYFNPIGGIVWWLNKFVRHRNLDSNNINTQIRLFDKYVVPISSSINGITKKFFGQSLLCVVKKL